jgi:hypothetical protein
VRIGPAAGDQPAVPAQQRLRLHQEGAPRAARQIRLNAASSTRSCGSNRGRLTCRRRIASSWRSRRISIGKNPRRPLSATIRRVNLVGRFAGDQPLLVAADKSERRVAAVPGPVVRDANGRPVHPPRSTIIDLKLPLGAVGAVDHHLFGFILFDDGQVCAPTVRLLLRLRRLRAGLAEADRPSRQPVKRSSARCKNSRLAGVFH